jgi:hypothetical protein
MWWRRITSNDLYNIEKSLPPGPKGQLHIDVPRVEDLHKFLGMKYTEVVEDWVPAEISVKAFRDPSIESKLTFRPRPKNNRYDIKLQNINAESSERHPAWTSAFGWPLIHGKLSSTADANKILAKEKLIIVLLRSPEGEYFADYIDASDRAGWRDLIPEEESSRSAGVLLFNPPADFSLGSPIEEQIKRVVESNIIETPIGKWRDPLGVDLKSGVPAKPKGGGQGYGLTHAERKAVELRAVEVAIAHFRAEGWLNVTDVGSVASYDLTMVRDGQLHIVEVKGTTSIGTSILLTHNEVQVQRAYFPNNCLFMVSEIVLSRGDIPFASGGKVLIDQPWDILEEHISPLTYRYETSIS